MQKLLNWFEKHILRILVVVLLLWIPLYPKIPTLDIMHTWVYIRLEDFLVALTTLVLIFLLLRRKAEIDNPLLKPIFLYWLAGAASVVWAVLFLAPELPHIFSHLVVLHYLRRIEYMILFFVVVASIRKLEDVKVYLTTIFLTLLAVVFYGFGQRFLGFPAFLTMNEEFSKGVPLYLPATARITSTFAGHYDLAAYLVILIALGASLIFTFRQWWLKVLLAAITFLGFFLLLMTASRISFPAYLLAVSVVLWLQKRKWLIIPVIVISVLLMRQISGGAGVRFGKTFRVEPVVFETKTGKPIATLKQLKATPTPSPPPKIARAPTKPPSPSTGGEDLPAGTGYLALPVKKIISPGEQPIFLESLKVATLAAQIATPSGKFLLKPGSYFVRQAIVYDISFTTRFQGEWPRAWQAFQRNWLLGSGFSSVSLATDNDYLRNLGESGLLGLITFGSVFFTLFLIIRQILKWSGRPLVKGLAIGLLGGLTGLLLNAVLIDVFEASKVAYMFWMLAGIVIGLAKLYPQFGRSLWQEAWEIFSSHFFILLFISFLGVICFVPSFKNYFVGDDFVWLKWAAKSSVSEIKDFFFDSQGFFYRPLAKIAFLFAQPIFSLEPDGYHLMSLVFHLFGSLTVYLLAWKLTDKKLIAFLTSLFFLIHPIHEESIFWIASLSGLMAAVFYLLSFLSYLFWRTLKSIFKYGFWLLAIIFMALALASHEVATTLVLVLLFYDLAFFKKRKKLLPRWLSFTPFVILTGVYFWIRSSSGAHGLSGDYSYHFANLPFNFLGNFLGYLGELTFSFYFVPLYQKLRFFFQVRKWLALILGLIGLGILRRRLKFLRIKNLLGRRTVTFTLGWMVITLLPFLGLGNMSERYVYLASFGYLLGMASFIYWLKEKAVRLARPQIGLSLLVLFVFGLIGFYGYELKRAHQDWAEAGRISKNTLLALSTNYAKFPPESNLVFANMPLKKGLAWVFPVGLEEAIEFIYRDESLKVYRVNTAKEAFELKKSLKGPFYPFVFEAGELKRAKR